MDLAAEEAVVVAEHSVMISVKEILDLVVQVEPLEF
jgi:hypothetical protein